MTKPFLKKEPSFSKLYFFIYYLEYADSRAYLAGDFWPCYTFVTLFQFIKNELAPVEDGLKGELWYLLEIKLFYKNVKILKKS